MSDLARVGPNGMTYPVAVGSLFIHPGEEDEACKGCKNPLLWFFVPLNWRSCRSRHEDISGIILCHGIYSVTCKYPPVVTSLFNLEMTRVSSSTLYS